MKKSYFGWFGRTAPSIALPPLSPALPPIAKVTEDHIPLKPARIPVFNREVAAGCTAMRAELVKAGYSSYVSDAIVEDIVCKVLRAAADVR